MKKIELDIIGLSYTQTQSGAYALLLGEIEGERRLPVIIGAQEAQAIAIHLENIKPPRPLTHDLFLNMAIGFNVNLVEVVILKLEEGLFYSELVMENSLTTIRIDARTSDAIALAIRFSCPIYTNEDILQKAGMYIDLEGKTKKPKKTKTKKKKNILKEKSIEELEKLMNKAIEEENYEKASLYRDEINIRKK